MPMQTDAMKAKLQPGRHVQISTPDPDQLECWINRGGFIEPPRPACIGSNRPAAIHIAHYRLRQLALPGVHPGASLAASSAPLEVVQVLVPVQGRLLDSSRGPTVTVGRGAATVDAPGATVDVDREPNTSCPAPSCHA
jgi:hypothetical protein